MVARIARAITPKTRAVAVTWVHSCTGVLLPIAPVAEVVARANRGRASGDRCLLIVDGGRTDAWPEMRPTIPTFDPEAPETWVA